jgi:hypothetical protein
MLKSIDCHYSYYPGSNSKKMMKPSCSVSSKDIEFFLQNRIAKTSKNGMENESKTIHHQRESYQIDIN